MMNSTTKGIRNRFSKFNKELNQKLKGIRRRITERLPERTRRQPDRDRRQPNLERRQSNLEREQHSRINWEYCYFQEVTDSENQPGCRPREAYCEDELPSAFTWELKTAKDEAGISKTVFVFTEVLSQEVFQRDGCHYFLPINHQVNVGKLLSLPVRPNTEGTFFLDLYQLIEDRVLKHVLDRHNLQRGQQLALHWLGKPANYLDKSNLSPNTFKERKHEVALLLALGAYEIIFTPGTCQKISVEVGKTGKRKLNFHFFKAFDLLDQKDVSANDPENVDMRLQDTEQERAEIIVSQVFPEVGAKSIKHIEDSLFANLPQKT